MNCPHCGKDIETDLLGAPVKIDGSAPVQQFIAVYKDAFRTKFKAEPVVVGMNAKAAKSIVQALGVDRAKRLAFAYVTMNDPFFLTKQHDLVTMYGNLQKISVALETGKVTTRAEINLIDRKDAIKGAFAHLREPEE